jgi:hypothetical protein
VLLGKSTKFVLEFCGLETSGTLALVDIATLSCFNHDFLQISTRAPCLFAERFFREKLFGSFYLGNVILEQCHTHSLNRWKLRLQLIVVLSLFVGNPFVDGILGHNLLLSRAFLVGILSLMGF